MTNFWSFTVAATKKTCKAIAFTCLWGQLDLYMFEQDSASAHPFSGWDRGVSYPGTRDVWGAPPSLRNKKYTENPKCIIFKKKIQKFFPKGAPQKCLGTLRECFPGPRCGSRRVCASANTACDMVEFLNREMPNFMSSCCSVLTL